MQSHSRQDNCLDEETEQFRLATRELRSRQNRFALYVAPKPCREAHHAEVVECCLFAEPNSLKSWMGQNVKSPFGNIRAGTYRLNSCSTGIAVANSSVTPRRQIPIACGTAVARPVAAISCLGALRPPAAGARG